MVQSFRVGRPRPGADAKPFLGRGMAQGQPGPAAKSQIIAASFHPLTYGIPSRVAQSGSLEARIAAGNQQQGGAALRIFVCGRSPLALVRCQRTVRLA